MLHLSRRHAVLMGLAAAGLSQVARAASPADAGEMLATMTGALQSAGAVSFSASLDFGGSAGASSRKGLGARVQTVFQRPDRLLAAYGETGDLVLAADGSTATLFRPSSAMKTSLPVTPGGTAFAIGGLFLPFMGLLAPDVSAAMLGDVRSVTLLSQGLPDQMEDTVLIALLSSLFTGEVWISKSTLRPAKLIGTFFDGSGGTAESASIVFSNWSAAPVAPSAFEVPGLQDAREVTLGEMGL